MADLIEQRQQDVEPQRVFSVEAYQQFDHGTQFMARQLDAQPVIEGPYYPSHPWRRRALRFVVGALILILYLALLPALFKG